jgi:hypothetical protein
VWPPEGLHRRRESPPPHAVVLQSSGYLSKVVYFRISAGNGVPGDIMVAICVQVRGGAACAVPESLLQDLHYLEVGYVVFIVKACAGA